MQRTLKKEGFLSGDGIHTGKRCRVSFSPLPAFSGIRFFKEGVEAKASSSGVGGNRCTAIGEGKNQILTVEHVLAALAGLGICNVRLDVEGPEIPALDGSALGFVRFFKKLGVADQREKKEVYEIKEPLFCYETGKALLVYPAAGFRISYILNYPHPQLRNQKADFLVTPRIFETQIAPARTFCIAEEARLLKRRGFGGGATYKNTLVISKKGVLNNRLRFKDECARHKVLDLIGDLSLLGFSLSARVIGLRSGHSLNRALVKKILQQKKGQAL